MDSADSADGRDAINAAFRDGRRTIGRLRAWVADPLYLGLSGRIVGKMGLAVVLALAIGGASSQTAAPERVTIDHSPVGCATVDRFAEIEARLTPRSAVARARVIFRAAGGDEWYFVNLTSAKDGRFTANLPKPLPQLKAFEYYIDAQTATFEESRTPDQRVDVVGRNVTCGTGTLARSAAAIAGRLIVSAIGGGAGLPAGFASSGLIAGTAAGAAAGTSGSGSVGAGAAGAAGGGISGTTLAIAGGVVVAAGAGVAVASGALGGDGDQGTCCHAGVFNITFSPFIDITVCGVGQMSGGNFSIPSRVNAPQGNFDSRLGSNTEPSPIRVAGFISPTSFNATVSCAAGEPNTITLSATGSDYNFSGPFTFGGRSGTWTVRSASPPR